MQLFCWWKWFCQNKASDHASRGIGGATATCCKHTQCKYHRTRDSRLHRVFGGLLPTVYAQEAMMLKKSGGEDKTLTLSEKVNQNIPKVVISDREVQDYLAKETGQDRLREMFTLRTGGEFGPDLGLVVHSSIFCGGCTFLATSIVGARQGKEKFLEEHQHTKFRTKFRAMRAYNDALFLSGMKFGALWAFKIAMFSGLFLLTSQSISVYRNKSSIWEYIAGGVVTCSVLRMNLGLKGMVAGGMIGSVMGCLAGVTMYGVLYVSNETQELRHYWEIQDHIRRKREAQLLSSSVQVSAS